MSTVGRGIAAFAARYVGLALAAPFGILACLHGFAFDWAFALVYAVPAVAIAYCSELVAERIEGDGTRRNGKHT